MILKKLLISRDYKIFAYQFQRVVQPMNPIKHGNVVSEQELKRNILGTCTGDVNNSHDEDERSDNSDDETLNIAIPSTFSK